MHRVRRRKCPRRARAMRCSLRLGGELHGWRDGEGGRAPAPAPSSAPQRCCTKPTSTWPSATSGVSRRGRFMPTRRGRCGTFIIDFARASATRKSAAAGLDIAALDTDIAETSPNPEVLSRIGAVLEELASSSRRSPKSSTSSSSAASRSSRSPHCAACPREPCSAIGKRRAALHALGEPPRSSRGGGRRRPGPCSRSADPWRHARRDARRALELAPSEREPWLEALAARDPTCRRARGAARRAAARRRRDSSRQPRAGCPRRRATLAGQTVGAYTLDALIGQGGMGSVWLARRSDGRFEGAGRPSSS